MPRTPFGDRSPWESSTAFQNRTREKEKEDEKIRRLQALLEQSKRTGQFFDNPETQALRQEIQARQDSQNKTYRGLLSSSHGFGLHDKGRNVSEPLQMQPGVELPNDDGINLNPFSYIGQGIMKGLEGWQKATEFTAGVVASPFSEQVTRNMNKGMSAGEAWRQSQFATKRFGADPDKGEDGFGFNLGVKGAVEMLVDPVGLATMAIPVGAIFRPIGKRVSTVASLLPGVKGIRKEGQRLLKEGQGFDAQLRNLDLVKENTRDFIKSLKAKGTWNTLSKHQQTQIRTGGDIRLRVKNGRLIDLDNVRLDTKVNTQVMDPSNYDSAIERAGVNREGLIGDFLRYANSDEAKRLSKLNPGRHFLIGVKNIHKLWNPAYTIGATLEGRAELAFHADAIGGAGWVTRAIAKLRRPGQSFEEIAKKNGMTIGDVERTVKKDGLDVLEKYTALTVPIRKEKVIAKRNKAMESYFAYGDERILEGEIAFFLDELTGEWSIGEVNGGFRAMGRLGASTRGSIKKTAQEIGEQSGLTDEGIEALTAKLNASADNMSAWEATSRIDSTVETALQPGKGHYVKYNDGDAFYVDTYAIDFAPSNEQIKRAQNYYMSIGGLKKGGRIKGGIRYISKSDPNYPKTLKQFVKKDLSRLETAAEQLRKSEEAFVELKKARGKAVGRRPREFNEAINSINKNKANVNQVYAELVENVFDRYDQDPFLQQNLFDAIKNYDVTKLTDNGARFADFAKTPSKQKLYKGIPVVDNPRLARLEPKGSMASYREQAPITVRPDKAEKIIITAAERNTGKYVEGSAPLSAKANVPYKITINRARIREDYNKGLRETAAGAPDGIVKQPIDPATGAIRQPAPGQFDVPIQEGDRIWERVRPSKELFPTYEDYENFVLEHEWQHFRNPKAAEAAEEFFLGTMDEIQENIRIGFNVREESIVDKQAFMNWANTMVQREGLVEGGFSPQQAQELIDAYGDARKLVKNIEEVDIDQFANLDQIRDQIFPPQRGVNPGAVSIGGKARAPIQSYTSAMSMINALRRGIDNNKLIITTPSKRRLKGLDSVIDVTEDSGSALNAIARNIKRDLDAAYENIDSVLHNPGKKADAFSWANDDGVKQIHHFGDNFLADGPDKDKFKWANLKAMNAIPNDVLNLFAKKYPDLPRDADNITMNVADFLDMAGYVVDYNGPFGKPIRLYEQYFNLPPDMVNYLKNYYTLFDEGAHLLSRKGIPPNNLFVNTTGNYVHHIVENLAEYQDLIDRQDWSRLSNGALKPTTISRNRFFDSVIDGIDERSLVYNQDPAQMAEEFLNSVYKEIADEQVVRRLENISHQQLKAAKFDVTRLQQWGDKVKEFRKKADEIQKIQNFVSVGGTLGNDIVDDLDRALRENQANLIPSDAKNWNKEYNKIKEMLKNPDDKVQGDVQRIIKDYLDELERDFDKDVLYYKNKIAKMGGKDIKLNKIQKKLSGLYGPEAVRLRMVTDQRGQIQNEVKALAKRNLFFDDKTAGNIEKFLNINKENPFDIAASKTATVNDYFRLVQTGFDAGTAFLHGLPTLLRGLGTTDMKLKKAYLGSWVNGTKTMGQLIWRGVKDGDAPRLHAELINKKRKNFALMANYGVLMSNAGNDYFRAANNRTVFNKLLSEGRVNNLQAKDSVPGFKQSRAAIDKGADILDGFQASFEAYGDMIREGLWDAHYQQILRSGVADDVMEQQLTQLAEYINGMTGAFSSRRAGISARQSNIERSVIFFSPSYTRATLGLIGSVVKGDIQGQEARRALQSMMGAGIATHLGFAALNAKVRGEDIDQHINLDPTSGKFLTTQIGNVNVGFGSAWTSMARLVGKIANDPAFRGDILDSPLLLTGSGRGRAGFDETGIKDYLQNNQILYWLRSRTSPAGSSMWDLGMGANFLGEELKPFRGDWFQELGSGATPFWLDSLFENGVLGGGTEFIGLRTNPISDYEKRKEVRDMLAQQYYKTNWRSLNDVQKRLITESNDVEADPNVQRLRELESEIFEKRRIVGGSSLDRNFELKANEIDDARALYNHTVQAAESSLRGYEISLEQYILREQKARTQYRYDVQNISEKYPDVEAYLMAIKGSLGDFERIEDFAADEYAEIMFDDKWDLGYMFDFEGRETELEGWRQRWGSPEYESYAKDKLYGGRRDSTGFNQEFYRRRDEYFPQYWEDTRKEIFQTRYQGQFDDIYREWYLSKYDDRKRQLIEENNQGFKQALKEWERLRLELRRFNPELDAFLYRWGFAESLANPANFGREDELKSRFPFEEYVPKWRVAGQ